jgi:hypothetical protein
MSETIKGDACILFLGINRSIMMDLPLSRLKMFTQQIKAHLRESFYTGEFMGVCYLDVEDIFKNNLYIIFKLFYRVYHPRYNGAKHITIG